MIYKAGKSHSFSVIEVSDLTKTLTLTLTLQNHLPCHHQ